jgi:hypothetical protein
LFMRCAPCVALCRQLRDLSCAVRPSLMGRLSQKPEAI